MSGGEDLLFGCFALGKVATSEDEVCDVEADEMLGRFEAEASVCACDNDGLSCKVGLGQGRRLEELAVEELWYTWHCDGIGLELSWNVR